MTEMENQFHKLLNQNYRPDQISKALQEMQKATAPTVTK